MVKVLFAISLCLFILGGGLAAKQQKPDPCANAQTTVEMRECANKEYRKADDELNRVYKQLTAKLGDEEHRAALKESQVAWIKYRDTNCEFESFENRGGTIYPIVYVGCLTSMTTARTKELREALKQN